MSRAFDTVKRETIIHVLRDAGCSEDDIRLVQYLLSNMILRVRVNTTCRKSSKACLAPFKAIAYLENFSH